MIDILLATYNGERYLREQLESIMRQSVQDFHIYIYDDGSLDGTAEIASEYQEIYPSMITFSVNERLSCGAAYNFFGAMIRHREHYVMLCDQDDVWLPDKLELSLRKMRKMEDHYGSGIPILLHTDLVVVDENLMVIAESYRKLMRANYDKTLLCQAISQNIVTGCTTMYNAALAGLLTDLPDFLVMHDWWLFLLASAKGRVGHLDERTVMYRQHGGNVVGAADITSCSFISHKIKNRSEICKALEGSYKQADVFLKMYRDTLSMSQRKMLERYASIPRYHKLRRIWTVLRHRHLKNGLIRAVAHLLYL